MSEAQHKGILAASRETASAIGQIHRQLNRDAPTTRDGVYDEESRLPSDSVKEAGFFKSLLHSKGKNLGTMRKLATSVISGEPLDDRKLLLEEVVAWLQGLPPNDPIAHKAGGAFIGLLWNDMPHPPSHLLGDEYRFRQADGSGNNPWKPNIGQAGLPYARSVSTTHPLPAHQLPSPGEIFDRVMRRKEGFREHPGGLNSLFSAFATTVIHTCFRTQRTNKDGGPGGDPAVNETSSYVDLSIIYGHNAERVAAVRTGIQGEIHPDVVAEDRLWALPSAVIALCVLFSRNHNLICQKLLALNERGTFKPWDSLDEVGRKKQDDELFGTARLINVGLYAQVVLHDYLRSILGLVGTKSTWVLDPRDTNCKSETATGNHIAIEFNFLYRWHATISEKDEKATEAWMRSNLPATSKGKPFSDLDMKDFGAMFKTAGEKLGPDLRKWEHYELKRGLDGRFSDDDLARVLIDASERPAHAFGARSTPAVMRQIEVMGMTFARDVWKTCTLNEFRRHLKLKPLESFAEFNPDPEIALAFEQFYGHVDNIELYPGLICEATKEPMVGAGLCPGYTASRAILSDAVALVRGDRFLTDSYDAGSLTAWGLESTVSSGDNGSFGGMLPGLFFSTLPNAFRYNSVIANFPLQTPRSMKENLTKLGIADKYDFARPRSLHEWQYVKDTVAVDAILDDHESFVVPYAESITTFSANPTTVPFCMGTDDQTKHDRSRKLVESLFYYKGWEEPLTEYLIEKLHSLVRRASYNVEGATMAVDIIRDVINRAFVWYFADLVGIPLKVPEHTRGLLTPHELYLILTGLFSYTAINVDPAHSWHLKETSMKSKELLRGVISARLTEIKLLGGIASAFGSAKKSLGGHSSGKLGSMHPLAVQLYTRAHRLSGEYSKDEIVNSIFGMLVASTTQPQDAMAQVIDFFLESEHNQHLARLTELSAESITDETRKEMLSYWREATRLTHATQGGLRCVVKDKQVPTKGQPLNFKVGDRILVDFKQLAGVENPFPQDFDPTRPVSQYRILGRGMHNCVATPFVLHNAPIVMREIFRLHNLRRAPLPSGMLKKVQLPFGKSGAIIQAYVDSTSQPFPFPTTMTVRYQLSSPVNGRAINGETGKKSA